MNAPEQRATAYLGLGSNLGDRLAAMRAAVSALDRHARISVHTEKGVASLYETAAVGGPANQPPYLNSALHVSTVLSPVGLLDAVLSIEAAQGRVRGDRWGPRRIDIDILLYENLVVSEANLSLPHPRLHERRFVLQPLAQIAGEVIHPVLDVTIADLARGLVAGAGERVTPVAGAAWISEKVSDSSNLAGCQ